MSILVNLGLGLLFGLGLVISGMSEGTALPHLRGGLRAAGRDYLSVKLDDPRRAEISMIVAERGSYVVTVEGSVRRWCQLFVSHGAEPVARTCRRYVEVGGAVCAADAGER